MSYKIVPTPQFQSQAKRLVKKFPSLKKELFQLEQSLSMTPTQGNALGHDAYKIRLAVKSKGKGKSGGMRIITYLVLKQSEVYLLSIYDKSEHSTISNKDLKEMIASISKH